MKSKKWARRRSGCKACYDGIYPYYGMAPHKHVAVEFGGIKGIGTRLDPASEWPANFEPDPEQVADFERTGMPVGQGAWHCPKCGKK
jgi:hypothetical protein